MLYVPFSSVLIVKLSSFITTVTVALGIGFPSSSVKLPVIVTLSPILVSGIGSTVITALGKVALNLSSAGFMSTLSFVPAVAVTLFSPPTILLTSTVYFPSESVVVGYTFPFTVMLTGTFGTEFPSLSVISPVMFVGLFALVSSGTTIDIVPFCLTTFIVPFVFAPSHVSFPEYSTVTVLFPTVVVGNEEI